MATWHNIEAENLLPGQSRLSSFCQEMCQIYFIKHYEDSSTKFIQILLINSFESIRGVTNKRCDKNTVFVSNSNIAKF